MDRNERGRRFGKRINHYSTVYIPFRTGEREKNGKKKDTMLLEETKLHDG